MDWIAPLIALTVMEIVLGIDNIVFIAILAGKLPENQQKKARTIGLLAALGMRLVMLAGIKWILGLTAPIFALTTLGIPLEWLGDLSTEEGIHHAKEIAEISVRDIILLVGGGFLIFKSVREIHHKMEGDSEDENDVKAVTFGGVIFQIVMLDVIFSLDSVITAVGMADQLWVMMLAVIIAIAFMLIAADSVSNFVEKHPTMKMLALSFLILIGVMLVMEGAGQHINKGYIYFAMAFAFVVEVMNLNVRKRILPRVKPKNTLKPAKV